MDEGNSDLEIELNDSDDVQTGRGTKVTIKKAFNFPAHILWTVYFKVDNDAKIMTCNPCKTEFKFKTKGPKSSSANEYLYTNKHRQHVLGNAPSGIDPDYWNEER